MGINQFLHQDIHTADKEMNCILDCMISLEFAFITDDYRGARIASEDMAKSFKVLEDMKDRKEVHDKLRNLMAELKAQGIATAIINRRFR